MLTIWSAISIKKIIDRIQRYKVPIIRLDKNNSREAICLVFEKVNVGGKKLDAFELVTAIYAADELICAKIGRAARSKNQVAAARSSGHPNRRDVWPNSPAPTFFRLHAAPHARPVG